MNEKLL